MVIAKIPMAVLVVLIAVRKCQIAVTSVVVIIIAAAATAADKVIIVKFSQKIKLVELISFVQKGGFLPKLLS